MVGAGGLGGAVVRCLGRIGVARGYEEGRSVVMLAFCVDRMTAAIGSPRRPILRRRPKAQATEPSPAATTAAAAARAAEPVAV
ncbi:MAG: proline/glycine betaine ABC transporter permease, partial [Microterricola sp.]